MHRVREDQEIASTEHVVRTPRDRPTSSFLFAGQLHRNGFVRHNQPFQHYFHPIPAVVLSVRFDKRRRCLALLHAGMRLGAGYSDTPYQ